MNAPYLSITPPMVKQHGCNRPHMRECTEVGCDYDRYCFLRCLNFFDSDLSSYKYNAKTLITLVTQGILLMVCQ
jgi:hypothetical protein